MLESEKLGITVAGDFHIIQAQIITPGKFSTIEVILKQAT